MYDVLVVGAGPSGSHLAWRLAAAGHRIAVLDKRPRPGWKRSCTGLISHECADRFGVSPHVVLRSVRSARLISPCGSVLEIARPETQAVVLDRAGFDIWLAERALRSGAEYRFNTEVICLQTQPDRVTVQAVCGGRPAQFEARAAVMASGFSPSLLRSLGFRAFRDFAVGAQVEVPSRADEVQVYFGRGVAPDFFAWLVPAGPGLARIGLLSRARTGAYLDRFLQRLRQQGQITSAEPSVSFGAVPLHARNRTYGTRLLLVGDAAGHVKPVTGGGIYFGLLGAEAAADTLHDALMDDDLSARRLARYESAWRKAFGSEIRTGCWARKVYERLSDDRLDRIFQAIRSSGLDRAILEKEEFAFDRHAAVALALVRNSLLSRIMGRRGARGPPQFDQKGSEPLK